jgi:hypothetical protein
MATLTKKQVALIQRMIVDIGDSAPGLNILVYGMNGSEKTRFGASAPRPLIFDVNEKGTRSAVEFRDAKVYPVKRWSDFVYGYWYVRDVAGDEYDSVVIDNLTTLQALCMSHVLKEGADRDPNKDPAIASQRDWGKVTELMKPLILNFRNLPQNCIFLAQERVVEDEEEETQHMPDLPRGVRSIATGAVDIIGRTYKKEMRKGKGKKETSVWEPRMLVGPHAEFITKDRTGKLPRIVRNPSVPKFLEAAGMLED